MSCLTWFIIFSSSMKVARFIIWLTNWGVNDTNLIFLILSCFEINIDWSKRKMVSSVLSLCHAPLVALSRYYPSKHLLVLKTSSTRLQRNNFTSSKTFWRHLEDVLKTSCKMSSRRLGRRRRLEDMSWRLLKDFMETNKILGISVYLSRDLTNLNV